MKKTLLCFLTIFSVILAGCSDTVTPEFSDGYLVGMDYGGLSWGEFYDCLDARLIICTDHEVLIFMPSAETVHSTKELEQIGTVSLSDEQYSNIERGLDRERLYNLRIRSNKDVLDGSSKYLFLYDKDNNIAKKCGCYMPKTKEFIQLYDLILDNLPLGEIQEIRKEYVDKLRSM